MKHCLKMSIIFTKSRFICYNYPMKPISETPLPGWQIESEITNQQLEAMQSQIDEMAAVIEKQTALIKYYENQLLMFKRRQFGTSSERALTSESQLTLFDSAAEETAKAVPELETEEISYKREEA